MTEFQTAYPITISGRDAPEWWSDVVTLIEDLPADAHGRKYARHFMTVIGCWLLEQGLHESLAELERISRRLCPFGDEEPCTPRDAAFAIDELTDDPEADVPFTTAGESHRFN